MIRLVEPTHPALSLGQGAGSPIIMAQVQAQAASAGGGILREFWVGEEDPEGETSSWLCRSGDSLWATVSHPAAAPQAAEFLQLLGGSLVQVDDAIMACMAPRQGVRRPILVWEPGRAGDIRCPPAQEAEVPPGPGGCGLQPNPYPVGKYVPGPAEESPFPGFRLQEDPLGESCLGSRDTIRRPNWGLKDISWEENSPGIGCGDRHPPVRLQIALPGDPSLARTILDLHALAGEVPRGARWDNLYTELHLRCRRGVAAGAVLWEEETAVACGALGSIGTEDAVVSHVCTLPEARRRGLAAQVVQALCQLAARLGRRPVLCCREELLPLYQGTGFRPTGQGHWILRTGEPT